LLHGVRTHEEVGDHTSGCCGTRSPSLAPHPTGQRRRLRGDRIETNAQEAKRRLEVRVARKVRSYFSPYDVTRHQRARVVCSAQRVTRFFAKSGVGSQDVEQDRGIDGGLHRLRLLRRRGGDDVGRGPRISSSRSSTGLASESRPKTWSTGWAPLVPLRRSTPPGRSSNRTAVPATRPSFSRTATGSVIWPLEETVLFMGKG
jgi:hypothetical protein